ncbi:hypothetical protein, partial [Streptomyces sp. CBMA156]|nr:hypothetical protein [Streptomyces sp. CBMA156]
MGSAGRPQGRFKGETEQANALARFVRELTHGTTVRELARRYPAGRTSWSEYRSAEKDIPWHLLQRLVHDHVADPRARAASLARARDLHERATRAPELPPPPVTGQSAAQQALDRAGRAQREAEEGVAEAGKLIRVLVAIVAELRGELGGTGPAGTLPDDAGAGEPRRARLRDATRCLAEVRRIRESARQVRQTAEGERKAFGDLADQERTDTRPDSSRTDGARTDDARPPEADPAVAGAVAAHLPVLWGVEGDLAEVREALTEQCREVVWLARSAAGPRVVRGELVRTADNHRSAPPTPRPADTGPPHGGSAGARRRRAYRTGMAMGTAGVALVTAVALAGVLVGLRVGTPAPSLVGPGAQAAGARLGPEAGAAPAPFAPGAD